GLEVDQGQSFIGFRLLQLFRDFTRLFWLAERLGRGAAGWSRLGVFEDLAVGVNDLWPGGILLLHPADQRAFELFGIDLLEQPSDGALTGHNILPWPTGPGPTAQA